MARRDSVPPGWVKMLPSCVSGKLPSRVRREDGTRRCDYGALHRGANAPRATVPLRPLTTKALPSVATGSPIVIKTQLSTPTHFDQRNGEWSRERPLVTVVSGGGSKGDAHMRLDLFSEWRRGV